MKLLPDSDQGKFLPVGLLVIALILVYLLGFHWFVVRHADYRSQIGDLSEQYQRFKDTAAQREILSLRLRELQSSQQEDEYFLKGQNVNAAAAELTDRIKQIISANADEGEQQCQVVSNQTIKPRKDTRFEKVTVNLRLRCQLDDFVLMLHELESSVPLVFVEELNIFQRTTNTRSNRRRNSNTRAASQRGLDIRFNLTGYLH